MRGLITRLQLSGALPDPDYVVNDAVNRMALGNRREPLSYELDFRPSWY